MLRFSPGRSKQTLKHVLGEHKARLFSMCELGQSWSLIPAFSHHCQCHTHGRVHGILVYVETYLYFKQQQKISRSMQTLCPGALREVTRSVPYPSEATQPRPGSAELEIKVDYIDIVPYREMRHNFSMSMYGHHKHE